MRTVQQQQFETAGAVMVRVDNRVGSVELTTHSATTTEVEVRAASEASEDAVERTRIGHRLTDRGHVVTVEVPRRGGLLRNRGGGDAVVVVVRLPEGASIDVTTASGSMRAEGTYGSVRAETASGDVAVGSVDGDLDAQAASGSVRVDHVAGRATVATASGDVRGGVLAGATRIKTASGDVEVGEARVGLTVDTASGDVTAGELGQGGRIRTASGDQRVRRLIGGHVELDTVSGDLEVAVARGRAVRVDAQSLTGSLSSEIDLDAAEDGPGAGAGVAGGQLVEVTARTVSGDVSVLRGS
jgi:DUF4097 and DUF4098 domain-containing protein YvlB